MKNNPPHSGPSSRSPHRPASSDPLGSSGPSGPSSHGVKGKASHGETAPDDGGFQPHHDDALWNLLGEASEQSASPFFARNILRETRLAEQTSTGFWAKLKHQANTLLSSRPAHKFALAASACICIGLATYTFWPNTPQQVVETPTPTHTPTPTQEPTELAEIVLDVSLSAAADDPSLFTRDEVVTMLGL